MSRTLLILALLLSATSLLPAQGAAGDECTAAIPAALGANAVDTTAATNSSQPYSTAQCTFPAELGLMASDVWYSYPVPSSGFLSVSTCGSVDFDSELVIYSGSCGSLTQVACNADYLGCSADPFTATVLFVPVTAGETIFIRLGGFSFTEAGVGTMTVTLDVPAPEDCTNGVDDDLDGFVDCADDDCDADPACVGTGNTFLRSDCNQGSGTDVSDAIYLLGFLFSGGDTPSCLDACDVSDDGTLDIGDAISLLDFLFGTGTVPPAPGPSTCGPDPTDTDPLGCVSAPVCP